jgi:glyoxylase-like metal-dependent hydrolase (beta-lactamase superfamily II)
VTFGTVTLDGGTWDVQNNVRLLGDQNDVLVIDAAHDADAIMAAVDGRPVVGILCTHGHNDHIDAAPELADRTDAPILLHPADAPLWGMTHATRYPDDDLRDGQVITMDGIEATVLHTPGIPPARCAFRCPRSASCSPGTLVRRRAGARPEGRSPTSRQSSPRSRAGCSPCRR